MPPSPESLLTQLRKGVLEYCVLARLRSGPAYGVELAAALSQGSLLASEGSMYPLLSRLRKQGWVETSWHESTGGPPRRHYSLTAEGRSALRVFVATWGPFSADVSAIMEES